MQEQEMLTNTQSGERFGRPGESVVLTIQQIKEKADRDLNERYGEDIERFFKNSELSLCIRYLSQAFHDWLTTERAQDDNEREIASIAICDVQSLLNYFAESQMFVGDNLDFCIKELILEANEV